MLVTRSASGSLVLASGTLFLPEESGSAKDFILHIKNLAGKRTATITVIDRDHGSPLPVYQKMGRPQYPTPKQLQALRKAASLPASLVRPLKKGELNLILEPEGLALIEVK